MKKEEDEILGRVDKGRLRGHTNGVGSFLNFGQQTSKDSCFQLHSIMIDRISTVKLKIPGKLFFKVGSRTSVTFKL